jgi:hypothetical protein
MRVCVRHSHSTPATLYQYGRFVDNELCASLSRRAFPTSNEILLWPAADAAAATTRKGETKPKLFEQLFRDENSFGLGETGRKKFCEILFGMLSG